MDCNKCCIVLPCNIYFAPFYFRYKQTLANASLDFDLIIWDRGGLAEDANTYTVSYDTKDKANNGNFFKIWKFYLFSRFVKKTIARCKYEKVIFLGSYAGNASFISGFLKKRYRYKYWFDIRDYTYEWFPPYYRLIKRAIANSYTTALSSEGYRRFLPARDYVIAHNIDKCNIDKVKRMDKIPSDVIRISFIGNIRYVEENRMLLKALGNDSRFRLQYFGAGCDALREYCINRQISNVEFSGRFLPEDTAEFYARTDIINNVYGNGGVGLQTALSNKLYFAAALRIPILVSPCTYMSTVAGSFGFGFDVDFQNAHLDDDIYNWYNKLKQMGISSGFDEFWAKAQEEDDIFERAFRDYLQS